MKSIMRIAIGSVLLVSALFAAETARPGVDALAWLSGAWEFEKGDRVVREQWMPPAGGTMLGMSRTVKAGKTIEYEFLRLHLDEQGTVTYTALPSRQEKTSFRLVTLNEREAVFENIAHDFPQRVIYTLKPDGTLLAAIEGPGRDGKTKRVEFPYKRVE